ncbi:helix-turn-helix transcriptional regulator [Halorientalis halophila]|uniref:helix-turn-helix transcriptional regulator n=1 Tax=Halorientalis halophila TaxID=3108499 RepID=UPI0030084FAF
MLTRAHAALLASLALLLTAGPVVGPALASGPVADGPAVERDAVAAQTADGDLRPPDTDFRIQVSPNGDAQWTVTRNYTVATEAERAAFRSIAQRFENGQGLKTLQTARRASDLAADATGREMGITGVSRESALDDGTGELVLEFTWTAFARQSDGFLYLDDVFVAADGTWFPTLGTNQSLTIVPPRPYDLYSASPAGYQVSNASLQWTGQQSFDRGQPAVVYERRGDAGSNTTGDPVSGGLPLVWVFAAAAVVLAVLVAYLLATRDVDLPSPATTASGSDADDGPGDAASVAGGAAASTTDGGTTAADPDPGDADIDEELLSDEERIERLLEQNGGRMKQANIVDETDWSNAKVSQLLSAMDNEGRIDKLRIGRENLISFPDEDVTDGGDDGV